MKTLLDDEYSRLSSLDAWTFMQVSISSNALSCSQYTSFLDASTHLYKSLCPSVGPSVGRSVRPLVTRFSNIAKIEFWGKQNK